MKPTESQKLQILESAQRSVTLAKVQQYEIMEKWPRFLPNPLMKNHAKRAKESIQQIMVNIGHAVKTKDKDYLDDHTYAMWRIFDKLSRMTEEQLFEFANGLDEMEKKGEKAA